jgi:hypothetical protein
MAHGDAQEGKWRSNWWMDRVASTIHTTSEHGVSSITTADAHTSAASSRLNWHPCRFKWTHPFRRKMKSGFCACAITFQTQSNKSLIYFTCNVISVRISTFMHVHIMDVVIGYGSKVWPLRFSYLLPNLFTTVYCTYFIFSQSIRLTD